MWREAGSGAEGTVLDGEGEAEAVLEEERDGNWLSLAQKAR